jgi:hypothetical protein
MNHRQALASLALTLAATVASTHPSVGIVQDRRGNIYYTDTKQVFRIAPDGKLTIAVPNVHTHELALDKDDNLFGEHLWYLGDASNKWMHRVWRMKPDGSVADVVTAREGFMSDYSLVRDLAGNHYWADRRGSTSIRKKAPTGAVVTLADKGFGDVQWMTVGADGAVYLIDQGALKKITPAGVTTTVVPVVTSLASPPPNARDRHYQMGLFAGKDGSVYVAVPSEKLVVQVDPNGVQSVAARSQSGWMPSGVLIDANRAIWMLECDRNNAMRVVKVGADGTQRIFAP